MKKADPRLMLIMSMTVFGTLGLFVRNISVSSGELRCTAPCWPRC